MATGTELFSLMTKCREYFGQLSALICDVDASLESGFPAPGPYDLKAFLGTSANPASHRQWGPTCLIRVYAKAEWNDRQNHAFWGFLGIYLYPDSFGQPIAAWGTVEPNNPNARRRAIFQELGMRRPNPRFVERLEHTQWVSAFANPLWTDVSYRACALVDLSSPGVVLELVIQPLCQKLNELNGPHPE